MGQRRAIDPESLYAPDRPWNHVSVPTGQPVYVAGQVAVDADGAVVSDDLGAQFEQCLRNVGRALEAAGGDIGDVADMTIYTTDMAAWHAEDVGQRRYDHLEEPYPSSTLLEVSGLAAPEYLVEVEVIAYIEE